MTDMNTILRLVANARQDIVTDGTPLTRTATAVLPLLIEAQSHLGDLAAPRASRLAERIGGLLVELIDVAGDVEAYGNKWTGGEIGQLATKLRTATADYNGDLT